MVPRTKEMQRSIDGEQQSSASKCMSKTCYSHTALTQMPAHITVCVPKIEKYCCTADIKRHKLDKQNFGQGLELSSGL